MKKTNLCVLLLLAFASHSLGCGSGETIMPDGQLTAEQLEKVRQEDNLIEEEEGGGGV